MDALTFGEKYRIESLIDQYGVSAVLDSIAEICALKAEHLRTNWQDETEAKEWERIGNAVSMASDRADRK